MRKSGSNFFGDITAAQLLTWLCCGAVVYSTFTSADAVAAEKFRSIEQAIGELKAEISTVRSRPCPYLGYELEKGK